uniref:Putative secreted protein n=1 Tax=Ixodes ricinus TaxID=34613 RepID=A0A6B0UNR7_IXORI
MLHFFCMVTILAFLLMQTTTDESVVECNLFYTLFHTQRATLSKLLVRVWGLDQGRMQEFPEGGVRCWSAFHTFRNSLPLSLVSRPKFYTCRNQEGGQDIRTPPGLDLVDHLHEFSRKQNHR